MRIFTQKQPRSSPAGGLYGRVNHPSMRWSSFVLVLCMIGIQPVHHVLADTTEEVEGTSDNRAVPVADNENEHSTPSRITGNNQSEIDDSATTTEAVTATATDNEDVFTEDGEQPLELDDKDTRSTTSSADVTTRHATSGDGYTAATTSPAETIAGTSTDKVNDDEISQATTTVGSEVASTTDSDGDVSRDDLSNEQLVSADIRTKESGVTSALNRYQFSDQECISVGDGAFYCQRILQANDASTNEDVVFSRLTNSGYRDIFLRTTQGTRNITDSLFDDTGPHYDPVSQTVVWHRDVEGRHQIFSYDIQTETVTQVTDTRANDMEPIRSGDVLVWQRWVDDSWQIMLLKKGDEERQLTADSVHNLAPYVRGNHVIWNTYTVFGEPRVAVFDTTTNHVMYIGDAEDGRVSNPRFVLVYDTLLPSGDRVTQEFDPSTGKSRPISSIPTVPLPDIPSPDPVGEARALQNKNQEDENNDILNNNDDEDDELDDTASSSVRVASSTQALTDVDMRQATTGGSTTLSEYDLVVTELATTSDSRATTTEQ